LGKGVPVIRLIVTFKLSFVQLKHIYPNNDRMKFNCNAAAVKQNNQ